MNDVYSIGFDFFSRKEQSIISAAEAERKFVNAEPFYVRVEEALIFVVGENYYDLTLLNCKYTGVRLCDQFYFQKVNGFLSDSKDDLMLTRWSHCYDYSEEVKDWRHTQSMNPVLCVNAGTGKYKLLDFLRVEDMFFKEDLTYESTVKDGPKFDVNAFYVARPSFGSWKSLIDFSRQQVKHREIY